MTSTTFLRFYLRHVRNEGDQAHRCDRRKGFEGQGHRLPAADDGACPDRDLLTEEEAGQVRTTSRLRTHVVVCASQWTFPEKPQRGDYVQMRVSSQDTFPHAATSLPRGPAAGASGLRRAACRSCAREGRWHGADLRSVSTQTRPGPGFHVPRHKAWVCPARCVTPTRPRTSAHHVCFLAGPVSGCKRRNVRHVVCGTREGRARG